MTSQNVEQLLSADIYLYIYLCIYLSIFENLSAQLLSNEDHQRLQSSNCWSGHSISLVAVLHNQQNGEPNKIKKRYIGSICGQQLLYMYRTIGSRAKLFGAAPANVKYFRFKTIKIHSFYRWIQILSQSQSNEVMLML